MIRSFASATCLAAIFLLLTTHVSAQPCSPRTRDFDVMTINASGQIITLAVTLDEVQMLRTETAKILDVSFAVIDPSGAILTDSSISVPWKGYQFDPM